MAELRAVISWLRRFFIFFIVEADMPEDKETKWVPTWLYRLDSKGKVEAVCFETEPPEDLEKWHDAPPEEAAPKRRGRPPKSAQVEEDEE